MNFRNLIARLLIAALGFSGAGEALAARTTTYLHTDGLGSVVAATNEAGAVLWRKDYAPFGEQLETSTGGSERISYTGKQHDDVVGLTNFGARQYDPEIGRFLNVDPVGFVDNNTMSFNRYLYVNNNPYKYVDPDGEFLNFAAKFVLDVGMNLAINYMTTGSLGVGMALKDSAMGILNPAKTVAKAGKLAKLVAQVNKNAPCPISCFAAGTTVLTERGYVPIETLKVGDNVWAHDPETGETSLKPILFTVVNTKDTVWELVLEKDGVRYLHEVTGTHPYYALTNEGGVWTHVADLVVGTVVETEDHHGARVISLVDTREVLTTYNFEVADINTYYVSAAKVLVHNCKKTGGRLGNASTRAHVQSVATEMEKRGWTITHGGGKMKNGVPLKEEYLPGPGGARKGSSYADITATKDGKTLRVNTVDTRADGVTMTTREATNAARIRQQTGGHLLTVPKP